MALRSALLDPAPLRSSPAYRRLWVGQACSALGGQMALVAVLYQVWSLTRSATWTGAVGMAQAIPLIAFGLFAGALVDRVDRRRYLLVATTGQAGCAALMAVQGFLGHPYVMLPLALVALQSALGAGSGPAGRTVVAQLLPGSQVAAGLALQRIANQAAMLVGPAVGGLIVAWAGVGGCYLADAVTFLVALGAVAGLPPVPPGAGAARAGLRAVGEGLRFMVGRRAVRGVLLMDLAATVLAMPAALFPLLNEERFGGDPRTLGLFFTAIAVGGVTASVFSGTFTRRSRPDLVMLCGSTGWGVSLGLLGAAPTAAAALALLAAAGAADTLAVVSRSTVVQLNTPAELLGRVAAAEQIVGRAGPHIGDLRAGVVADLTSARAALASGGLLCVAAVLVIGWISRPAPPSRTPRSR